MNLSPYIIFNGNCEEALRFYANALNGEVKDLMHYEGTPAETMADNRQKVLHAQFEAGDVKFMASDDGRPHGKPSTSGTVHFSLSFDTIGEQERVFGTLGAGGKVTQPLHDTFWGAHFGMLTDRFGMNWMFTCEAKKGEE